MHPQQLLNLITVSSVNDVHAIDDIQNAHVFVHDQNSNLLFCNSQQAKIHQIMNGVKSREDLYGLSVMELYALFPERACQIVKENEFVLANKIPQYYYSTLIIPNVTKINFLTIKIPHYDSETKQLRLFGIACYLQQVNLQIAQEYFLTSREVDCIEHFLDGKSAKGIAEILALSSRTVESYLDNIKGKLDCQNKQELMTKLKKLNIKQTYIQPGSSSLQ